MNKDYANRLLNDIGRTTFFQFQPDGTVKMNESVRDGAMASLDELLNSYLRTLSPEDKRDTLAMIGKMAEKGFDGEDVNDIPGVLLHGNNTDLAANLAAYLLVYKTEHPELVVQHGEDNSGS